MLKYSIKVAMNAKVYYGDARFKWQEVIGNRK